MVTTFTSLIRSGPWTKAFLQSGTEFGPTSLKVLSGMIPDGLRGSFYRNGPALFKRGGESIHHWFDGDGAILAVHFTEQGTTSLYRYVQTEALQAEAKAGKFFYGSYGRTPTGAIWKQLTLPVKNCANSAVLALSDRILALWEAGAPHALDPYTLTTHGLERRMGLEEESPYSAHPKRDPYTGDIYNFGVEFGPRGILHLYRSDASGKICQRGAIPLDGLPLIHDFVLTQKYLIFFIPPVRLSLFPFLTKRKSFSDALSWLPKKGTQILVVDRRSFAVVSKGKTEPWFQWRFGNGYEESDGTVVLDLLLYEDFQINQFLTEVASRQTRTSAKGTFWRVRLNPESSEIISIKPLVSRGCEFPTVAPHKLGQPHRYTYLSLHRPEADLAQELPGTIACFDHETNVLTEADLGLHRYPFSPIYASDTIHSGQGWILSEVFDSDHPRSELWIFDAANLAQAPVCRLAFPLLIPFGFHGTWQAA
jgi:all-trans-8'-apo-beta-carotenal 15,15'-oxygenase